VNSVREAEDLLNKARKVRKRKTMEESEIDYKMRSTYATIARRCRDDKNFGFVRYPYKQGPSVIPFTGGFFEHREAIRRGFEKHPSLSL
jgi:hypothetical protein